MHRSRISGLFLAAVAMLGAASAAKAQFVFGNFEGNQSDNFGSWNGSNVVPFASDTTGTTYSYSNSTGVTLGSSALVVKNPGSYQQDLAFDFKANGDVSQFLANDVLSFDITAPSAASTGSTAGYWQIYQVFLNGQGAGFQAVNASNPAFNQYYYAGFNGITTTLSFNYDSYKAALASNPSYLSMILATNTGGGAPPQMYFDNFRLTSIPEPATFGVMAMGAVGLLARRRARKA